MAVTRETLYEEIWAEPMTKVADRYRISSNFLARICERLRIPRPPRGHWARLEVGKTSPKPVLPAARPGDELEWVRGGYGRRVPRALPQPPSASASSRPRGRRERPGRHALVVGVREHFDGAKASDHGYLRPAKRRLVDLFVTTATLDHALEVANELFLALEDRGHEVVLAPVDQHLGRPDVEERSEGGRPPYGSGRWRPDRPTVVHVGTVAIGLTLFELTEEVEVAYVDGTYVRVADVPPPTAKRARLAPPAHVWTHRRDMPTGRLCLRASSPYLHAAWQKQWREEGGAVLTATVPQIVRTLEAEAATIARLVAERERQAEIERQKWEAEQARWRAEEAEKRCVRNTKESRDELFAVIAAWGVSKQVEGFFEDAARRAAELDEETRNATLERLHRARALVGDVDALRRLRAWRAPDER